MGFFISKDDPAIILDELTKIGTPSFMLGNKDQMLYLVARSIEFNHGNFLSLINRESVNPLGDNKANNIAHYPSGNLSAFVFNDMDREGGVFIFTEVHGIRFE